MSCNNSYDRLSLCSIYTDVGCVTHQAMLVDEEVFTDL